MTFTELASPDELTDFLNAHSDTGCVVTFSATWCGPCKASKPKLKDFATTSSTLPIGYVYEEDLEDFLDVFVVIKSFPTYILFHEGTEVARVEGVNLPGVEAMIQEHQTKQAASS